MGSAGPLSSGLLESGSVRGGPQGRTVGLAWDTPAPDPLAHSLEAGLGAVPFAPHGETRVKRESPGDTHPQRAVPGCARSLTALGMALPSRRRRVGARHPQRAPASPGTSSRSQDFSPLPEGGGHAAGSPPGGGEQHICKSPVGRRVPPTGWRRLGRGPLCTDLSLCLPGAHSCPWFGGRWSLASEPKAPS